MIVARCVCAVYLVSLITASPTPAHTCSQLDYISRSESDHLLDGLRSEDVPDHEASDELKKRQSGNRPPLEPLGGLSVTTSSSTDMTQQGFGAFPQQHQNSGNLRERLWQGSFSDASVYAAQRTGEASTRASKGICKFFKACGTGIAKWGPEVFRRLFTLNLDIADRNTVEGKREINKIALQNFVTAATLVSIFSGTLYTIEKDFKNRRNTTHGKRADSPKSQAINFKIDWRDYVQPQRNPVAVIRQYQSNTGTFGRKKILTSYLDRQGEFTVENGRRVPVPSAAKRDASMGPDLSQPSLGSAQAAPTPKPSPRQPTEGFSSEFDVEDQDNLEDLLKVEALNPASSATNGTTLIRRDLRGATDCAPTSHDDFYKLLKHIWLAVIFPSLLSGESLIQVMIAGPVSGSEYLLVNGGDLSLTVWVTEEADKDILLSPDPVSLVQLKSQDPKPLRDAECYSVGIPKDADAKPVGPSISWWNSFFNICGAAFGSHTVKLGPKDFLYAGQPKDPEEKGYGAGWYGKFVADGCEQKYSCEDMFGIAGNGQQADAYAHTRQCMDKTPDGIYHGGVFYHQVPAPSGRGTVPCGYFVLTPLAEYMDTKTTDLHI